MTTFHRFTLIAAVAVGTLLAGCGEDNNATSNAGTSEPAPATPAIANTDVPADVKIVTVDLVAKSPESHAGRIGIQGIVARVFPDRGAFILIDPAEFAKCGTTTCALYSVPVLTPNSEFKGDLPQLKQTVLAVGTLKPEGKGYRFVVEEVRRDNAPILSRTKPASHDAVQALDHLPSTLLAQSDALVLTDEQIAKLKQLHAEYTGAHGALQKKIAHCQAELVELLEKKPVDQAKVDHEKEEIEEFKEQLAQLQKDTEESSRSVLTPEQSKKVNVLDESSKE